MPAISVTVKPNIYTELERLVQKTGFSKSKLTNLALENYIEEAEDILLAEKIAQEIDDGKMQVFTLDEVRKEFGL